MLDPKRVDEVKRLLAIGLSVRKIALATGIGRSSVSEIKAGRRPDYENRPSRQVIHEPGGPAKRCPTCGVKVQLPCVACAVPARGRGSGGKARELRPDDEIDLQLKPEHAERLEEVQRVQRQAAAAQTTEKAETTPADRAA